MRYTVENHGNGAYIVDNNYVGRCFGSDQFIQTGKLDLTEASICAWALNAVAEGYVITKLMAPVKAPGGPRYAGFYCQDYSGPTDGVKPE